MSCTNPWVVEKAWKEMILQFRHLRRKRNPILSYLDGFHVAATKRERSPPPIFGEPSKGFGFDQPGRPGRRFQPQHLADPRRDGPARSRANSAGRPTAPSPRGEIFVLFTCPMFDLFGGLFNLSGGFWSGCSHGHAHFLFFLGPFWERISQKKLHLQAVG